MYSNIIIIKLLGTEVGLSKKYAKACLCKRPVELTQVVLLQSNHLCKHAVPGRAGSCLPAPPQTRT